MEAATTLFNAFENHVGRAGSIIKQHQQQSSNLCYSLYSSYVTKNLDEMKFKQIFIRNADTGKMGRYC